ncbi:MAG TPA: ABC transporter ATP-binding protein [Verrucomicrobiae bacterium]|nr:ABC transporter ATP-binding protein [Verrucomicrobiae bacterium]
MIELRHVQKVFSTRVAVADLSLSVPSGEIFGLLGHNGAGKSTAIGMMLGQVWPTKGDVLIRGHNVASHRSKALRKVGAIFESPAFYDYLSGFRNLEIFASYTATTPRRRIEEVAEWVGLGSRASSKVRTYSHGMRARLALAQALLPDPELLILDEPSDGLDPEGIHEMRQTILRLHRELKLTILLSSHLLNEVEQICTRIAVLNQGRKVYEGSLAETRERQQWLRLKVNDFAAATNLLLSAGLITASRNGALVSPAPGASSDQIVRLLVERGISVFEIARQEESLEDFYLSLMKERKADSCGISGTN